MTGEYRVVIIVIISIIIMIMIMIIIIIIFLREVYVYIVDKLAKTHKEISVNLIVTPLSHAVHLEGVYRKKSVFPWSQKTGHFVHMILLSSARYWGK